MAKRTTPAKDFQRTEWKGFLERDFSAEELFSADEWQIDDTALVEGILALNAAGYKLTTTYSGKTKVATATLMAGDEHPKIAGHALSAKGVDGRDAIKLLMYKHFHLLEEDWTSLLDSPKVVKRG